MIFSLKKLKLSFQLNLIFFLVNRCEISMSIISNKTEATVDPDIKNLVSSHYYLTVNPTYYNILL